MQRAFRLPPLFTTPDLLLIVGLGVLTVSAYSYRWLKLPCPGRDAGLQLVVQLEKEVVGRYDLASDTSFTVDGYLGPVRIEISGGAVSFRDAPCPQKICEKSGSISRRGAVLVCAPSHLLARIEDPLPPRENRKQLDSMTR
ncbi:MAG: NusG domain II-containing protein [Candidatus Glassbacteria bacterium]|nr:NusG domain II-containing protein [Candidatus Glassbacteria bacterium]